MPAWEDITVRTAPGLLELAARRSSNRPALLAASAGNPAELTELRYPELADRAERVASGLRDLGVEPGERVGLLLDNRYSAEAVTTYHASHLLGAVNVALNGRWVARELAGGLDLATPRVVVCGADWYELCRDALLLTRSAPRLVVVAAGSTGRDTDPVDFSWLLKHPPLCKPHQLSEEDDADWVFTSGTTGEPKAVRFTHGQTVATGMQVAHAWGLSEDDRYHSPSPLFTSTGCRTNLLGALAARCTYLPEPVADLAHILELAREHRPTVYFGVSSMFRLLLDREPSDLDALRSLRRLVYGGMVMPLSFHEELNTAFANRRGVEVMHLMGLTEGGPTGVYLHPDDHRAKPGAVGDRGFSPWTELSVRGETTTDSAGELYLRSPSMTRSLITADGARTSALEDGWLPTGDVVSVDADGFLSFVDRKRDIVRRGGMNIASGEVEAAFKRHPGVIEVAVVAKPHRVLGEDLCAFVVLDERQATIPGLRTFCSGQLADYKVPRDVRIVNELPLNGMGRVRKGQLRQSLLDE